MLKNHLLIEMKPIDTTKYTRRLRFRFIIRHDGPQDQRIEGKDSGKIVGGQHQQTQRPKMKGSIYRSQKSGALS